MATTKWYQEIDTEKKFRLGTEKKHVSGARFIYSSGVASNAVGSVVVFRDSTYAPTLVTNASLTGTIGISAAANTSTTNYSWYMVFGNTKLVSGLTGKVAMDTGSTDKASCSTSSSTSGNVVGGGVVATKTIVGMYAQGVSASNLGDAFLNYPCVAGGSLA